MVSAPSHDDDVTCPVCDARNVYQHDPPNGWECHDCGAEWTRLPYPIPTEVSMPTSSSPFDLAQAHFAAALAYVRTRVLLPPLDDAAREYCYSLLRDAAQRVKRARPNGVPADAALVALFDEAKSILTDLLVTSPTEEA